MSSSIHPSQLYHACQCNWLIARDGDGGFSIKKGDEVARFDLGSTVVLVWEVKNVCYDHSTIILSLSHYFEFQ
jgi:hypothetical protein